MILSNKVKTKAKVIYILNYLILILYFITQISKKMLMNNKIQNLKWMKKIDFSI